MQIQQLERELGAELFRRTRRGVEPTEAGRALLGGARELLAAAGASEEIVTAALDFSVLAEVRNSINVFHDRRPELYRL